MRPWETIDERFEPMLPVSAARAQWRVERTNAPTAQMLKMLDRSKADRHFLLLGTYGIGKSTEVLRVAEARAGVDFVVFVDLRRHFEQVVGQLGALRDVSPWEICFLAAVGLIRAAEAQLGHSWPSELIRELEDAWLGAARASEVPAVSESEIDVLGLGRSMLLMASVPGVDAALKAVDAAAKAVSLPTGLGRRRLNDQERPAQRMVDAVNRIIGSFQRAYERPALLVIDGTDRIRELPDAERLLIDSELLSSFACKVVLNGPSALRFSKRASDIRRFNVFTLPNVPVLDQARPSQPGVGVGFFLELYRRRTADLPPLVSEAQLERLAYYCGGRARLFVRFVRKLAFVVEDGAATDSHIDEVLRHFRLDLERGVDREDIELLESVIADPKHRLPGDARARELLGTGRLVPFPNESEWYYPHPLLTLSLVSTGPGSSSSGAS